MSELKDDTPERSDPPEWTSSTTPDRQSRASEDELPEYESPADEGTEGDPVSGQGAEGVEQHPADHEADGTANNVDASTTSEQDLEPSEGDDLAEVPAKAHETLEHVDQHGEHPPGFRGGDTFQNDGRDGGEVLPRHDDQGKAIHYQEWDVNPYERGVDRGRERLVTGAEAPTSKSDPQVIDSAYYTDEHYESFTRMR